MSWRVLISCVQMQKSFDLFRAILEEHGIEADLPEVAQGLSEADLLKIIEQYDGIITGDDEITASVIAKASRLKVIAKWGIGIDGIDLEAARERGIPVSNTPGVFADEVADIVMGYVILLARRIHNIDRAVRQGEWLKVEGTSLHGKVLGVVGLGSVGQAVVRRGVTAGMPIIGHDIVPPPDEFVEETGITIVDSIDDLLRRSDFISLNCPLTESNYHMLSNEEFSIMNDGVYIINTARGPLIDEDALITGLRSGKVAGAALDVFEDEPLKPDSPLHEFGSCIFGSHNASNTREAVERTSELAVRNLIEGLERGG